jgi:carboxyl-terminal processing protease
MVDGDGDQTVLRARRGRPHAFPLAVLVDGRTASAAEIFAGSLKAHGRAVVIGERTFGKGTASTVVRSPDGARYEVVATLRLPDGTPLEGNGVAPDLGWDDILEGSPLPALSRD